MNRLSVFLVLCILWWVLSLAACTQETTYANGDTGPSAVGLVCEVSDGGRRGFEVAPVDQSTGTQWSTITDAFANGSSALPADIGRGSANTDAIIAENGGAASTAKLCRDYPGGGLNDWFLPSLDELVAIWENLVREDDGAAGWQNSGVGGFTDGWYLWSSTESTEAAVWLLGFATGHVNFYTKGSVGCVRAVREFYPWGVVVPGTPARLVGIRTQALETVFPAQPPAVLGDQPAHLCDPPEVLRQGGGKAEPDRNGSGVPDQRRFLAGVRKDRPAPTP